MKAENKTHYTVGRGTDCEIRLSDISVSRNHAVLSYEKGYWQLTDAKSKFGTLLLVDEAIDLKRLKKQSNFQIGKTVVQITMKQADTQSCFCGKKTIDSTLPLNPFEVVEDDPDLPKETEKDEESVVMDVNNKNKDIEKSGKMNSQIKDGNNNANSNMVLNDVPESQSQYVQNNISQGIPNQSTNSNADPQIRQSNSNFSGNNQMGIGININAQQEEEDLSDIFEYGDSMNPQQPRKLILRLIKHIFSRAKLTPYQ